MSCVNEKYTPEELESIFVWDLLCDMLPITREERAEIRQRDGKGSGRPSLTEEQKQHQREYLRMWRAANQERIQSYNAAHREEIRERQREYEKGRSKGRLP